MNIQAVLDAKRALRRKDEDLVIIANIKFIEEATREFGLNWHATEDPKFEGMAIRRDDSVESFVIMARGQDKPKAAARDNPEKGEFSYTERVMEGKLRLQRQGSAEEQIQVRMNPEYYKQIVKENKLDPEAEPSVLNLKIILEPSVKEGFRMIDLRPRYSKNETQGRAVKGAW